MKVVIFGVFTICTFFASNALSAELKYTCSGLKDRSGDEYKVELKYGDIWSDAGLDYGFVFTAENLTRNEIHKVEMKRGVCEKYVDQNSLHLNCLTRDHLENPSALLKSEFKNQVSIVMKTVRDTRPPVFNYDLELAITGNSSDCSKMPDESNSRSITTLATELPKHKAEAYCERSNKRLPTVNELILAPNFRVEEHASTYWAAEYSGQYASEVVDMWSEKRLPNPYYLRTRNENPDGTVWYNSAKFVCVSKIE